MKHALSRGEWLLISAPLILFGGFAALYVRWKAVSPAVLTPSPVPLYSTVPSYDGRSVMGLGAQVNALNNRVPGTPLQFLLWNAKDGHLRSQFSESRLFTSWRFSRDGSLLVLHIPGKFNFKTKKPLAGTVIVLRTSDGSEVASWPLAGRLFYLREIGFSLDNREIITVDGHLERHDVVSGKLLGAVSASKIFSPTSSFERISFSPGGHLVAVMEGELDVQSLVTSSPATVVSTSTLIGGRMEILAFPSLLPVMRPRGDLYSDCAWESEARLRGISTMLAGSNIQKLVRSQIDLKTKQTSFEELKLPSDYSDWNRRTLAINGATNQVVFAGNRRAVVWGSNGQIETNFYFSAPVKGGSYAPGVDCPPRFSPDGRGLYRIDGSNIERYDLSRYLPKPTPAQTSPS